MCCGCARGSSSCAGARFARGTRGARLPASLPSIRPLRDVHPPRRHPLDIGASRKLASVSANRFAKSARQKLDTSVLTTHQYHHSTQQCRYHTPPLPLKQPRLRNHNIHDTASPTSRPSSVRRLGRFPPQTDQGYLHVSGGFSCFGSCFFPFRHKRLSGFDFAIRFGFREARFRCLPLSLLLHWNGDGAVGSRITVGGTIWQASVRQLPWL